jgi:hypothetical protein
MDMQTTTIRDQIEAAAKRLGATQEAVFKWRQRGIPADWKLKLISDAETSFSLEDLDRVKAIGVRSRTARAAQ